MSTPSRLALLALALAPALALGACSSGNGGSSGGDGEKSGKGTEITVASDLPAEISSLSADPLLLVGGKGQSSFGSDREITPMLVLRTTSDTGAKARFTIDFEGDDGVVSSWTSFARPIPAGEQTILLPVTDPKLRDDATRESVRKATLSIAESAPLPDAVAATDVVGTIVAEADRPKFLAVTGSIPGPLNAEQDRLSTREYALCTSPDGDFVAVGEWTASYNSDKPLALPIQVDSEMPLAPVAAVQDDTECLTSISVMYPTAEF